MSDKAYVIFMSVIGATALSLAIVFMMLHNHDDEYKSSDPARPYGHETFYLSKSVPILSLGGYAWSGSALQLTNKTGGEVSIALSWHEDQITHITVSK